MSGSVSGALKDPKLLRRLLRARDRMDSASHEDGRSPDSHLSMEFRRRILHVPSETPLECLPTGTC